MTKINLRAALSEGQDYVAEVGEELSVDVQAMRHELATTTCYEKADLLGWDVERIVKVIFFRGEGKLYGLVFPELGTSEDPERFSKKDLGAVLGYDKEQMSSISNSACPEGMEYGTCTPFVPDYVFEDDGYSSLLVKIFVHDAPWLDNQIVDISIGGEGEEAHKTSLHLSYSGIYDILERRFGDKIVKENLLVS